MRASGVTFTDGYGEKDGDAILYNISWKHSDSRVRLFKLHGSIDWYLVSFRSRNVRQFCRMPSGAFDVKDGSGTRLRPDDFLPIFLTGTSVKERQYGKAVFADMFEHFRTSTHKILLCSGYGWRDQGINARIDQWLHNAPGNVIVIMQDEARLSDVTSAPFWAGRWDSAIANGSVKLVPKWFCDCSISDIEEYCA